MEAIGMDKFVKASNELKAIDEQNKKQAKIPDILAEILTSVKGTGGAAEGIVIALKDMVDKMNI